MTKKLIEITLFILMLAALGSIAYWAAFDATWWKPIARDEMRGMALYMLHMVSLVAFPFYKTVAES